jgi:hypothetical protein
MMDTAWIQVFVLTISECVAPTGKTVCQQQEYQLEFASAAACEVAREQFIALKSMSDNVIVDQERTRCAVNVRQGNVYATLEEARTALGIVDTVPAPQRGEKVADFTEKAHKERLESLPTCEEARGRRPCKIGEIIVEGESEQSAEVWRRNQ